MPSRLPDAALDQLFHSARSHNGFIDEPVDDGTLTHLHELFKWGPTAANSSPLRIVFLRGAEAKERLRPALAPGNVAKATPCLVVAPRCCVRCSSTPSMYTTTSQSLPSCLRLSFLTRCPEASYR